jgi:hypothetical protein
MMVRTISYREICYLVNRLGIHFSVFYRQKKKKELIELRKFIHHTYVSPIKYESRYTFSFYASFSSSFSTGPLQSTAVFNVRVTQRSR